MAETTLFEKRDIRCIAADPPWDAERGGGKVQRGADRHYPLLSAQQIVDVIRFDCPDWSRVCADAHLWLWCTNTTLANEEAHFVAKRLGFRPLTVFTWGKVTADGEPAKGLGRYGYGATEHLLLCVKGSAMVPDPADRRPTFFTAETTRHSEKPEEGYDIIESISPGERLEIFARDQRPGWTVWGNEVGEHREPQTDLNSYLNGGA